MRLSVTNGTTITVGADEKSRLPQLRERFFANALTRATEVIVVGDAVPPGLFDEVPELAARINAGLAKVTLRSDRDEDLREARRERMLVSLTPDERAAIQQARERPAITVEPHPLAPTLQKPPLRTDALEAQQPGRIPSGPMTPFLGARMTLAQLMGKDDGPTVEEAMRVHARPVVTLLGQVLVIPSYEDIAGAIRALLRERIGDLPFDVDSKGFGGPGKYLHIHASITAPPDGDVPMAIELYARIGACGPLELASDEGVLMLHRRRERADKDFHVMRDLPTPYYAVVRVATYANIMLPGVGIPCYE